MLMNVAFEFTDDVNLPCGTAVWAAELEAHYLGFNRNNDHCGELETGDW